MRINYSFEGNHSTIDVGLARVVIGRPKPGLAVDVDLSPDKTVSRPHAVLYGEAGQIFIEDLDSTLGTQVNGHEIKGDGPRLIRPGDVVRIGSTTLQLEFDEKQLIYQDAASTPQRGDITQTLDAQALPFAGEGPRGEAEDLARRMALLYDLPLQLASEDRIDALLQIIVERVLPVIVRASTMTLLVRDRRSGQLLLKAHLPSGHPTISLRLAQQAMERREGFVWVRADNSDITAVIGDKEIQSAMYAPLLWKGEALGVLCAANHDRRLFSDDDLRLLVAVAQQAAMAVVQRSVEDELRVSANLMARLLVNFSPKVRDRLMHQARTGRPQLGGQRSEVTILMSDIRGFTQLIAGRDTDEIVDMLNAYFSAMVEAVFRFGGTVDKFIGDAMLVVFGSPEADPRQHENAVRAALAIQAVVADLSRSRQLEGRLTCEIGIGLHCGEVLHGFIGSMERMEFTVIGDVVNWASRYCSAAAGGEILISPQLHQWVWRMVRTEPVRIHTKHEGELLALRLKESLAAS